MLVLRYFLKKDKIRQVLRALPQTPRCYPHPLRLWNFQFITLKAIMIRNFWYILVSHLFVIVLLYFGSTSLARKHVW